MSNKIFSELKKRHEEIKADYAIAADNSTHWTRLAGRRLGEMIALEKAMAAIAQIGALLDPQPEAASPEFASEQGEPIEEMIATSDAVCEELSEAYTPPQIPEGFTPWSGGECPVELDAHIRLVMDNGYVSDHDDAIAGHFNWAHDETCGVGARIIAYRIIEASTQSRAFMVANGAEVRTAFPAADEESRDTLITDDIPSIPREEIPIGSAVETYTDSGIETVKISGTTYVVDDEPVAEASYAPINSEPASDALMWANGFEADAKAKAEPEQDKRPFWVFGKKELA